MRLERCTRRTSAIRIISDRAVGQDPATEERQFAAEVRCQSEMGCPSKQERRRGLDRPVRIVADSRDERDERAEDAPGAERHDERRQPQPRDDEAVDAAAERTGRAAPSGKAMGDRHAEDRPPSLPMTTEQRTMMAPTERSMPAVRMTSVCAMPRSAMIVTCCRISERLSGEKKPSGAVIAPKMTIADDQDDRGDRRRVLMEEVLHPAQRPVIFGSKLATAGCGALQGPSRPCSIPSRRRSSMPSPPPDEWAARGGSRSWAAHLYSRLVRKRPD